MRNYILLLFFGLFITLSSCRKDFSFEQSTGGLEFSKQTVYLDTVFTNIGSSTYTLKVHNKSNKDISIPSIQLTKGDASKYRIMVDGMTGEDGSDADLIGDGKKFKNVELLANDSLYVFIETTASIADANPLDFLYTDKIEFSNITGAPQTVDLVTLIQDALFIYPDKPLSTGIKETLTLSSIPTEIEGHELSGALLNWTNAKPIVVYGFALVPNGSTLNIQHGTKVHFHANSGLIIDKNGTLNINGQLSDYGIDGNITIDREIRFEGDRLEPSFENVPGQWFGIVNFSTNDNNIEHLTLKNASLGIYSTPLDVSSPYTTKLSIKDTQIYNCSNFGVFGRCASITGSNLVVNNCGQASLACTFGGSYNFTHCTFNNNWNSTNQVALLVNNYLEKENSITPKDLIQANFTNCIIYGGNQIEMLLKKRIESLFNYNFKNCLIKFNNINNVYTNDDLYKFTTDSAHYLDCKIATNSTLFNPKFKDINKNKLWPTEDLNLVIPPFTTSSVVDILGKTRTNIGAYQFIPN